MKLLLFILLIVIILVIVRVYLGQRNGTSKPQQPSEQPKPTYTYTRKQFIMTQAENTFYQTLRQAVGDNYEIFPQVHLDAFLDHRVKGQNWTTAKNKIDRKSVDFLICSKSYHNPLVAIELDDSSHNQPDRKERDTDVDSYMAAAGMPIVHVPWQSQYNADELRNSIAPHLTSHQEGQPQ